MDTQSGVRILGALTKAIKLNAKYGDNADAKDYNKIAEEVCQIEFNNVLQITRIDQIASAATSVEDFEQNLVDVSRSTQRFDKNACKRYKDFARMAKDTSETRRTNDFEISQAVHTIVDIDPLTKQPLSNPVRNKICKHIYGKDSVVQALQKNPRLRCPIMGCGNRGFVQLTDLIEDETIMPQLERQREQA